MRGKSYKDELYYILAKLIMEARKISRMRRWLYENQRPDTWACLETCLGTNLLETGIGRSKRFIDSLEIILKGTSMT